MNLTVFNQRQQLKHMPISTIIQNLNQDKFEANEMK